jgi:hypothetical protein
MTLYVVEYGYSSHIFFDFIDMMKTIKGWWRDDGKPYWYTLIGKRSHFPTSREVRDALTKPDGFYREYSHNDGNTYYLSITKSEVDCGD